MRHGLLDAVESCVIKNKADPLFVTYFRVHAQQLYFRGPTSQAGVVVHPLAAPGNFGTANIHVPYVTYECCQVLRVRLNWKYD